MAEREVVVVTGASGGVGRAVAQEFARHGAAVGLIARGRAGLDAAARDVSELGGEPFAYQADVADFDAVDAAASAIEEHLGPIDLWVNNAMTTVFAFLDDIDPHEYERATRVTYLGAVWGTKAALARMLPRDRGTIVQVGSALAYRGIPLQAPYCGAKHAMKGMFDSLRCELRHRGSGVRATMVQLPGMNTPQFDHCLSKMPHHPMPVPPIYQPEVAARAIYSAAHAPAHRRRRELHVGFPPSTRSSATSSRRRWPSATWRGPRSTASRPISGSTAPRWRTCSSRSTTTTTRARTASSTTSPTRAVEQAWLSRHRLGSGLAAAGVAGGAAAALLTRRHA